MATASQLLAKIQSINIPKEVEDAFNQEAYFAEDLNREQLMDGMGGDKPMPEYSIKSVTKYGKPKGRIKLFDTGDFQKGITYVAEGDRVKSFSTDKKNDFLEDMYDFYKPLKLTPENKKDMAWQMQARMAANIGEKTGLK